MEIKTLIDASLVSQWALTRPTIIDVRAPGEFLQGHLPGSINAPLLDDRERELVGTCYKQKGQDSAIRLGHELISGERRDQRMQVWLEILNQHPNSLLTCFRGGLRSKTVQEWLLEAGYRIPRISGGYKECRQQLLGHLERLSLEADLLIVSGSTGSGKTHFLNSLQGFWPTVDLEGCANHRGSAFGKRSEPQPSQAVFENAFLFDWLKNEKNLDFTNLPLLLEDESRLIGRLAIPDKLFEKLRMSPVVWLEVELEERVGQIFRDYIIETDIQMSRDLPLGLSVFQRYKKALLDIQRRLGGARTQEIMKMLEVSEFNWIKSIESGKELDLSTNRDWIRALLKDYYDPMYLSSLEKRQPKIYFRGSPEEARAALLEEKNKRSANPVNKKAPTV